MAPYVTSIPYPDGRFTLWASDDDVIGLTVAKTYPSGWAIVRTEPPLMDGFDEYQIGEFIAWCLSHYHEIQDWCEDST